MERFEENIFSGKCPSDLKSIVGDLYFKARKKICHKIIYRVESSFRRTNKF